MSSPVCDELIDHGRTVLDEVRQARPERGHRLGSSEVAPEADPRRIHPVAAEHPLHAEPRCRGAAEGDDGLSDEVRPSKAGSWPATQEEEPVPVVHRGEVDEPCSAAVAEIEASHDSGQGDVRVPVQERVDCAPTERPRRLDLEPLGPEMSPVYGDR
jgi:hypothetical protein